MRLLNFPQERQMGGKIWSGLSAGSRHRQVEWVQCRDMKNSTTKKPSVYSPPNPNPSGFSTGVCQHVCVSVDVQVYRCSVWVLCVSTMRSIDRNCKGKLRQSKDHYSSYNSVRVSVTDRQNKLLLCLPLPGWWVCRSLKELLSYRHTKKDGLSSTSNKKTPQKASISDKKMSSKNMDVMKHQVHRHVRKSLSDGDSLQIPFIPSRQSSPLSARRISWRDQVQINHTSERRNSLNLQP